MKFPFLKVGARGIVHITDYRTAGGECQKTRENTFHIEVKKVRSVDFIVSCDEKNGASMYCKLPVNKKDLSEAFWLTDDGNGFIRHFVDKYDNGDGIVETRTETAYQF